MSGSEHRIHIGDSSDLSFLPDRSIALVVTSPPYPMIEMWDEIFSRQDERIQEALHEKDGKKFYYNIYFDAEKIAVKIPLAKEQHGENSPVKVDRFDLTKYNYIMAYPE